MNSAAFSLSAATLWGGLLGTKDKKTSSWQNHRMIRFQSPSERICWNMPDYFLKFWLARKFLACRAGVTLASECHIWFWWQRKAGERNKFERWERGRGRVVKIAPAWSYFYFGSAPFSHERSSWLMQLSSSCYSHAVNYLSVTFREFCSWIY